MKKKINKKGCSRAIILEHMTALHWMCQCLLLNPNGPELLESINGPCSELTNYNPNAKTDVTLHSQLLKLTI